HAGRKTVRQGDDAQEGRIREVRDVLLLGQRGTSCHRRPLGHAQDLPAQRANRRRRRQGRLDVQERGGRVEDRDGPSPLIEEGTGWPAGAPESNGSVGVPTGWIVAPAFDLLLIANLSWPFLLLPGLSTRTETAVDFWQVYFLSLPHRWLTLILVALDPD